MRKHLLMALLCFLTCIIANAQRRTVTGTVLSSSDNEPVIGASVMATGLNLGVATDNNGRFTISIPAGVKTLTISSIGMNTVVQNAENKMTVYLDYETSHLDDALVVAYGTAKKSSYAGSAAIVNASQLKDLPNTNFGTALNGKVAGLQVSQSSGQAGSAPTLRIRGIGSMNASNEPLYVIDGVPVNSGEAGQMSGEIYTNNNLLNTLNPEDIASISVLKDAAASSLYGSRAANGVVIITTKRGSGRPVVSFNASLGFTPGWATNNYETASVQENVNMLYSVFHDSRTAGSGASDEDATKYALSQLNKKFNKHGYQFSTNGTGKYENVIISEYDNSGREGKYFDWDDAYFRTAVYQTYDLSASGSHQNTNYYSSISYTSDKGRVRVNDFSRLSARVNLDQKIGKIFELSTNASFARTQNSGYNDTRNTRTNLFFQSRNLLWGLYWPTNYKTGEEWTDRYGSYAFNNIYYNKEWENSAKTMDASISETLTIHLLPTLDVKSILSYNNSTVRDHVYYSNRHYLGSATNGSVNEMRTTYEKAVSSTTADWTQSFGRHNISLLAGFEAEKNNTDYTRASGQNLPTSTLHTVATAGTTSANGYSWGNAMLSVLSKADYNWNERYFVSASFRRDGSSRLSPSTRWGNFWSVSGAWRITEENFMCDVSWLNNLKLRASYGTNGTLPTNNYGYINLMSYTYPYLGEPGGTITTLANEKLRWETSYSTNIGLDFGLFNDRLTGTVEYFNRDSKDLLQDVPISMVTGVSTTLQNIGQINNHGLEIDLNGTIIRNNSLIWTASANITFLNSSVKKLYNGADIIWYDPTGGDDRAQYIYREGCSTLQFYGYEWAGVDKTNGKSVYYTNNPDNNQAGDFIYNGRGATYDYKKANYTLIGDATPWASGGFSTSLSYKGIDFSANFTYKIGGDLYDGAYKDVADDGYYWERIRAKSYYDKTWTPANPDGTEPGLSGLDLEDAMQFSSRHIWNASYLRLKNVVLGYTLPQKWTRKAAISKARIWFSGSNLLTFSAYKEADPEVNQYGTRGWETPLGRTYVFGINLNF